MLASFKGGTAFVEAGIDEIDDTETAGEGGTFVVELVFQKQRGHWHKRYRG